MLESWQHKSSVSIMALSPSKRFAIMKRDGFTCRYCGRRRLQHLSEDEFRRAMMAEPVEARMEMTLRQCGLIPDIVLGLITLFPGPKAEPTIHPISLHHA